MNCFGALSQVKWPQACELISDSLFYSIGIYVYPYANQQHCLNYCGFVVSFKIIQYQSFNCALFLKIVLDILSSLCSYMIFRINLTTFGKKNIWNFGSDYIINTQINLESTAFITVLSFYLRTQDVFPSIQISFHFFQ